MDAATAGVVQLNGLPALAGGVWSAGNTVYTIPYSGLAYNTAYTVNISGFTNATGSLMAANNTHGFTTSAIHVYSVTYHSNGGSGTQTDPNSPYASGAQVTVLDAKNFIYTNYYFTHWNTKPDGSGISYSPGDVFTITSDIALYAQWEYSNISILIQRLITVEPAANGRVVSDTRYARTDLTITLTILPDPGYMLDSIEILRTGYETMSELVAVIGDGDVRTFRMPPYGVTVRATFKPYDPTANVETDNYPSLQVYVQDGVLYVNGLTAGQSWSVYNTSGALIYQGVASADNEGARHALPLPGRGVYIVQSENSVIKITN